MFVFGLIVGLIGGGVSVAAYLNNIHSAKVKGLEDKVTAAEEAIKNEIKN